MFSLFVVCFLFGFLDFVDVITRLLFWLFLWVGFGLVCLFSCCCGYVCYVLCFGVVVVGVDLLGFDFVVLVCCIVYYKCW